jgi:hypothetical protein
MPTSQFRQLNKIVEAIVFSKPRSGLDVGVGFARNGLLTREYLDKGWGVKWMPMCRATR